MPPTAEEVLAQHADEYKAAQSYSKWTPPVGDYLVAITGVRFEFVGKNDKRRPACMVDATILSSPAEQFDGKDFGLGFFSTNNWGMLKDLVIALGGTPADTALEDGNWIREDRIGTPLQMRAAPYTDKAGNPRVGMEVLGLAPEGEAAE